MKKKKNIKPEKKETTLKVSGSFEDLLKVAVAGNPKPKQAQKKK